MASRKKTRHPGCEHKHTVSTWRRDGDRHLEFSRHCAICDVRVSMGPSADHGDVVRVELSAAGLTQRNITTYQLFGWMAHEDGRDAVDAHSDAWIDWWTGWLAREMSTWRQRSSRDAEAWPWDPALPVSGQYEAQVKRITDAVKDIGAEHDPAADWEQRVLDKIDPHDPTGSPIGSGGRS